MRDEELLSHGFSFCLDQPGRGRKFRKNLFFPARGVEGSAPLLVFCHGFITKTELYRAYGRISLEGVHVFLLDYPDNFAQPVPVATVAEDILSSIAQLRDLPPEEFGERMKGEAEVEFDRFVLAGHSKGSAASLEACRVAGRYELEPAGVVGLSPPALFGHRPDYRDYLIERFGGIEPPVLLITGDRDPITPLDGVRRLMEVLPPPKALAVVRGANHTFFSGWENPMLRDGPAELAPSQQLQIGVTLTGRFACQVLTGRLAEEIGRLAQGFGEVELAYEL